MPLSGRSRTSESFIQIHSLSLPFPALPGFKTALQSRTVLDSRDRDYPPWSFYRQEIVWCKTLPQGHTTSELTDSHISMYQGRGKETVSSLLTQHLTWERRIRGACAVEIRPVTTQMCALKRKKKQGSAHCTVTGMLCHCQQVQDIVAFPFLFFKLSW